MQAPVQEFRSYCMCWWDPVNADGSDSTSPHAHTGINATVLWTNEYCVCSSGQQSQLTHIHHQKIVDGVLDVSTNLPADNTAHKTATYAGATYNARDSPVTSLITLHSWCIVCRLLSGGGSFASQLRTTCPRHTTSASPCAATTPDVLHFSTIHLPTVLSSPRIQPSPLVSAASSLGVPSSFHRRY